MPANKPCSCIEDYKTCERHTTNETILTVLEHAVSYLENDGLQADKDAIQILVAAHNAIGPLGEVSNAS